jgi:HEAT repeat protein
MNENPQLRKAIDLLADKTAGETARIGACHQLGQMSGQEAIGALVAALSDADVGVRWAAADALRHHGPAATEAVLAALVRQPSDSRLYESARHALSDSGDPLVKPVLKALADPIGSGSETPLAAYRVLKEWREKYP